MVTAAEVEAHKARYERISFLLLLLFIALWLMLGAIYRGGYLPGSLACVLFLALGIVFLVVPALIRQSLKTKLEKARHNLEIQNGTRLANGEPIAMFESISKYRVTSRDGHHTDWEVLTPEKRQQLIEVGLLRDPSVIPNKGVSH